MTHIDHHCAATGCVCSACIGIMADVPCAEHHSVTRRQYDRLTPAPVSGPVTHPHPIDGTHEGLRRDCGACDAEDAE